MQISIVPENALLDTGVVASQTVPSDDAFATMLASLREAKTVGDVHDASSATGIAYDVVADKTQDQSDAATSSDTVDMLLVNEAGPPDEGFVQSETRKSEDDEDPDLGIALADGTKEFGSRPEAVNLLPVTRREGGPLQTGESGVPEASQNLRQGKPIAIVEGGLDGSRQNVETSRSIAQSVVEFSMPRVVAQVAPRGEQVTKTTGSQAHFAVEKLPTGVSGADPIPTGKSLNLERVATSIDHAAIRTMPAPREIPRVNDGRPLQASAATKDTIAPTLAPHARVADAVENNSIPSRRMYEAATRNSPDFSTSRPSQPQSFENLPDVVVRLNKEEGPFSSAMLDAAKQVVPESVRLVSPAIGVEPRVAPSPQVAQAVAQQMAVSVAKSSTNTTELVLSPEELGRVRMSVNTQDGVLTLSITAERPDTQDLMRRHIDLLAQEMRSLGFDGMAFSFTDSGAQNEFGQSETANSPDEAEHDPLAPEAASMGSQSGLDLRL